MPTLKRMPAATRRLKCPPERISSALDTVKAPPSSRLRSDTCVRRFGALSILAGFSLHLVPRASQNASFTSCCKSVLWGVSPLRCRPAWHSGGSARPGPSLPGPGPPRWPVISSTDGAASACQQMQLCRGRIRASGRPSCSCQQLFTFVKSALPSASKSTLPSAPTDLPQASSTKASFTATQATVSTPFSCGDRADRCWCVGWTCKKLVDGMDTDCLTGFRWNGTLRGTMS